jgi:transcriptional regulator with XRE-family HTH domain
MKLDLKNKAVILRREGFSYREISEKLKMSKGTASLWLRDVELSKIAKKRIQKLGTDGRNKGIETNRKKIETEDFLIEESVKEEFDNFIYRKIDFKIACALLYWGEGTKHDENSSVSFMNSDPEMIKYFLHTFRNSFEVDEKKFRGLIHLHEYHDEEMQLKFWSNITKIPIAQFNKSYLKKNTGKNKKIDYPGCLSIRYSDVKIYKEIMFIIKELAKMRD